MKSDLELLRDYAQKNLKNPLPNLFAAM